MPSCSLAFLLAVTLPMAPFGAARGQDASPGEPVRDTQAPVTLFTDVRIFDGRHGTLSGPSHVLVKGNVIARISATPITDAGPGATVIPGDGRRVLMPGLIDMHWHMMLVRPTPAAAINGDVGYLNLLAGA
ncbi:MAG TPA: hypothetical protein VFS11_09045, partial [Gemmatimonadales bacterium]|nr:hypothetical protein [Gemmatimonadales bacterium]